MNQANLWILVDVNQDNCSDVVTAKRGDTGRRLTIHLSENGKAYKVTPDCKAVLSAKKPDGTILWEDCSIQESELVYQFSEQTCACPGTFPVELQLYGGDGSVLTTTSFTMEVHDTLLHPGEDFNSKSQVDALESLVKKAHQTVSQLEDQMKSGQLRGKSAYEVAVQNGYSGTEDAWVKSLPYQHSEEFTGLANQIRQNLTKAEAAATKAEDSKLQADNSANASSKSAAAAYEHQKEANTSAENASQYKTGASDFAAEASRSATSAATSAAQASSSMAVVAESAADAAKAAADALKSWQGASHEAGLAIDYTARAREHAEQATSSAASAKTQADTAAAFALDAKNCQITAERSAASAQEHSEAAKKHAENTQKGAEYSHESAVVSASAAEKAKKEADLSAAAAAQSAAAAEIAVSHGITHAHVGDLMQITSVTADGVPTALRPVSLNQLNGQWKFIKRIVVGYELLIQKPADWETNQNHYFYIDRDIQRILPTTSGRKWDWTNNFYYTKTEAPDLPVTVEFSKTADGDDLTLKAAKVFIQKFAKADKAVEVFTEFYSGRGNTKLSCVVPARTNKYPFHVIQEVYPLGNHYNGICVFGAQGAIPQMSNFVNPSPATYCLSSSPITIISTTAFNDSFQEDSIIELYGIWTN